MPERIAFHPPLADWERALLIDEPRITFDPEPAAPQRPRDARGRFTARIIPRCGQRDCTSYDCQRHESDFVGNYDYEGYDRQGFDQRGFDQRRDHRNGTAYDDAGFNAYGYDADGYNRDGYNRRGYDREGYSQYGYDSRGYDREGYSMRGFNRAMIHRNGTRYDDSGFTYYGLDSEGFNEYGRDDSGYDRDGYDYDGYNREGLDIDGRERPESYCENCESSSCDGCSDYDSDESDALHSYSYTPRLRFNGESGPYYGMEIEVTLDAIRRGVEIVDDSVAGLMSESGSLVYCKSDSSVDGMEMVTHPMSYDWAMANFPWDMLTRLKEEAGATVVGSDNGIHVHVGRDGFSNSAHLYRWFKLWYRNPSDIQRIARRRETHWGAFRPDARTGHKEACKKGKPSYNYTNDTTRYDRYAAINTTNDATLEVRVFASSLRPQRVKAALQLVAASVEYTRQLTPEAVLKTHGWEWRAFMSWVRRDRRYPDLVKEDRIRHF